MRWVRLVVSFIESLKNKSKHFIKNLKWQDYVFIFLIILYLIFHINLLSEFKQLPSPIYGGDLYYSMGTVQHTIDGGSAFESSNVLGSEPIYLPFYTLLAAGTAKIFGLSAFSGMKVFAVIQLVAALIVFYLFASYLFKNKSIALAALILYLPLSQFPVFKYLQFTYTLLLPAYFLSLLYFFKKRSLASAIVAGIIFGLVGISHSVGFVFATLFFMILFLYLTFFEHIYKKNEKWNLNKKKFKSEFWKAFKMLLIIGVIGGAIAMLYWFKPIFVYHAHTLNPHVEFNQADFSLFGVQMNFIWRTFKLYFFNFSEFLTGAKSLLFIIGFLSIFFLKKYDASKKFLILLLLTTMIGSFHFFLSQPLIGTNLSAEYVRLFSFGLASALFAGLGLGVIVVFVKKHKEYLLIGIIALLLVFNILNFMDYSKSNRWIKAGRTELSPNLVEMQNWVLQNTDINDVFLSTNELNFALNGLTGRKQVNSRRAHNSMFLDVDKRQLAAAIMLYTNDSGERRRILKEYSVDYLYWDYYWFQSEYYFDDQGKMTGWFDPIIIHDTREHREVLNRNNISFFKQHTWLDPTTKHDRIKQFDLIFIIPTNFNLTHPWHPDLDNYLKEVWNYTMDRAVVSRIYRIINMGEA